MQSTASTTNLLCYDALGRVTSSSQVTNSQTYTFPAYTWNLVGSLTSIAYPSGRVVTTSYDKANRPYQVAGTLSSNSTTYASCPSAVSPTDPCSASHGALTQLLFGNQQTEQTCYNNRLQPFLMRFGPGAVNCSNPPTTPATTDLLNLALGYGGSTNNGNLQSQAITRQGTSWSQSYGYDKLNRLLTASEGSNWSQTNAYDAFGNRWVTNPTPPTVETPTAPTWYTTGSSPTGCPPWQPNRISGWCYDAAGNITSVTGMQRTFAYDAENRQTTATINGTATTYAYDGDGRRVQKVSGGVTTAFVYDAQGQLTAEYGPATDSGTTYLTIDHLGSTRLLTNSTGAVKKTYDYKPFGEDILAGVGSRGSTFPAAS